MLALKFKMSLCKFWSSMLFLKTTNSQWVNCKEHQKMLSIELQARNERLKEADRWINILEEEISNLQEDNENIKEKSSSTVDSIKNLKNKVSALMNEKRRQ